MKSKSHILIGDITSLDKPKIKKLIDNFNISLIGYMDSKSQTPYVLNTLKKLEVSFVPGICDVEAAIDVCTDVIITKSKTQKTEILIDIFKKNDLRMVVIDVDRSKLFL